MSSIIVQLRTEKIALAQYLYRIGRAELPDCSCDHDHETISHVPLDCSRWNELREEVWGPKQPSDLTKVLSEPKLARKADIFMIHTGLLGQFAAVAPPPVEDSEDGDLDKDH